MSSSNGRRACFVRMAGALGLFGATSCLVPDADYCAFVYGDASCLWEQGVCVLATEKAPHDGIEDGCSADVPEGFVHVRYGLPTAVAAPEERLDDPHSVRGVLTKLGYEGCGSQEELEARFESVVRGVAEVRAHLEKRGRVRRAALELHGGQVEAIEAFEAAMGEWIDECAAGTTTGSTTGEETTTTTAETDSESSTTGPMWCMRDEDCSGDTPFCNLQIPDMGVCVACDGMPDMHAACAGMNSEAPVCFESICVQCTLAMPEACINPTPVCDAATNTCVPCTAHEQCGEAACNLFTGACLEEVAHVGPGQKHATLSEALAAMKGPEGAIFLHVGPPDYNESITVNGGQVIAFLAAERGPGIDPPQWVRTSGNTPQLTVNAGGTVLLDGMQLSSNLSSMVPGLRVTGGRAWVDRSRIVLNTGGGIVAESSAELTLRNSFVGDGTNGQHGLSVDASSANVLSTTLGAGFDNFANVFPVFCNGSVDVTIRNSLLVSFDNTSEISCSMAMVTNTASETLIPGMGNVALGAIAMDWFVDITVGDFHLDNPPAMLDTTARWTPGDPPTDIDGDPRPNVPNSPDYAGADVMP